MKSACGCIIGEVSRVRVRGGSAGHFGQRGTEFEAANKLHV